VNGVSGVSGVLRIEMGLVCSVARRNALARTRMTWWRRVSRESSPMSRYRASSRVSVDWKHNHRSLLHHHAQSKQATTTQAQSEQREAAHELPWQARMGSVARLPCEQRGTYASCRGFSSNESRCSSAASSSLLDKLRASSESLLSPSPASVASSL